jgi:WD40 repeat protein
MPTTYPPHPLKERRGVFISYARTDGEEFARRLREHLEAENIRLWQDRVALEGGRDWWLQITEAVDQVEFMALVITPNALKSDIVRREWRYARQQGVCVYPIKGAPDIDFNSLPRWMRDKHFYDIEHEWINFINGLRTRCQTPRVPFMVEDLPIDFVPRPEEFNQLVNLLLDRDREEPVAITAALRGAGGYGKTTLARAICHDERIQNAFDDGVLWVTLGENPGDLTGQVEELIYHLSGDRPSFTNLEGAIPRMKELLEDRDILLVIDDLWNKAHLRPFTQGGSRCARLITTRNLDTLPSSVDKVKVDSMKQNEAVALLAAGFENDPDLAPASKDLTALAGRLGEWPLLLKLVNGFLRKSAENENRSLPDAISRAKRALDKRGLTYFDVRNSGERNDAVAKTIGISLDLLTEREKERYFELAIFPEDVDIPSTTLEKLWSKTGGLDEFDTDDLCIRLNRLSLLLSFDASKRNIRLHDVIHHYLIEQTRDQLSSTHNQLLDAHPPSGAFSWAALPGNEPYLWDHLALHLVGAGRGEELVATVKDLHYLAAKGFVRNAQAVEADLLAAEIYEPNDGALRLLRRSFAQAGHILNRCDSLRDLSATLLSRLQHLDGLSDLTATFAESLARPYLASWRPLSDLPHPALVRSMSRHTGPLTGCSFSADGAFIVSTSTDNSLRVWDAKTGAERLILLGHTEAVTGCAVSADSALIVSSSSDRALKLWDAKTGAERLTLTGHGDVVKGCAISRDGSLIVSASTDKTLKVWNALTGDEHFTLTGHSDWVNGCAISADGSFIVSASSDNSLKVWNAGTGAERFTLMGHTDSVMYCSISSDGSLIVSASDDRTLKIWDARTGAERLTIRGHTHWVNSCAISPDGSFIASASEDKTLKVWDTETGAERLTISGHTDVISGCAISPNSSLIVSASYDQMLKLWDAHSGAQRLSPSGHDYWVTSCAVCADGSFAVTSSYDRTLKVWDTESGTERLTLSGHRWWVMDCAISSDGSFIVSASADQTLKVWNAHTGADLYTIYGHDFAVNGCVISNDGALIASASSDGTLKVWDARTGDERLRLFDRSPGGNKFAVNSCALSPDGDFLVSASSDKTLIIWRVPDDFARAKEDFTTHRLSGHAGQVNRCAISANGDFIVSASHDQTLKVWNKRGSERLTLVGHTGWVKGCAISPDSALIASVSDDKTLKVWDARGGDCLATLYTDGPLNNCSWFPDGRRLVAVGDCGVYFLRWMC